MNAQSSEFSNQDILGDPNKWTAFEKFGKALQVYGALLFITVLVVLLATGIFVSSVYNNALLVAQNKLAQEEFAMAFVNLLMGLDVMRAVTLAILGCSVILILYESRAFPSQYKWTSVGFAILAVSYFISLTLTVLLIHYYISAFDILTSHISTTFPSINTVNLDSFDPWYAFGIDTVAKILMTAGLIGVSLGFDVLITKRQPALNPLRSVSTLLMITSLLFILGIFIGYITIIANLLLAYAFLKAGKMMIDFTHQTASNK